MKPKISLQLYTLRDQTQADMLGTLEKVAALGYQGIELAGYGNADCLAVAAKTRELGLSVTGSHISLESLDDASQLEAIIADNQTLGNGFLIVGWVGAKRRGSYESWRETARILESGGRALRQRGFTLCYHNHAFEFEEQYDSEYVLDILFSRADPQYLQTELDCYWVQKGGESPVKYLQRYAGRIPLVHIKDMTPEGDFAEVGEGTMDWPPIFAAAEAGGTQVYVVEQDECSGDPLQSVAKSISNLRLLGKI